MPLAIACDARALFHSAAESQRERDVLAPLVGRRCGYREALIAPPVCATNEVRQFCYTHAWFPHRTPVHRVWLSLLEPPERVLADLNHFQPDVIHAYGSYLAILFRHLHETGAPFHRPRAILYGSDGLADPVRSLIAEEFGIPVFSVYGAIEAFRIAFECEQHTGQHVNAEWYPVRIVDPDGRPLPPGEEGQVVLSNLVNRATVLLNYRQGDLASLLPEPCPCGRALPLMSFLNGRRDDMLHLPGGRVIHPMALRLVMIEGPPVWEYQIVQETPRRFALRVIPAPGSSHTELPATLSRSFAELLGQDVQMDIRIVESLERTPAGKHRTVITRASLEEGP
jgi:phenylacetate-CoA ligase